MSWKDKFKPNKKVLFGREFCSSIYGTADYLTEGVKTNPHYREEPLGIIGAIAKFSDRERICLNSYNYLGLLGHPEINKASKDAIDEYGTGSAGVRCLSGSRPIHTEFENLLAKTFGYESALIFSSGFLANFAAISSLMSQGDVIYVDQYAHRSLQEGCFFSGATIIKFKHNNMLDLENELKNTRADYNNAMIVADGVYSMHGNIADVPRIVDLGNQYKALTYIDEAHSFGTLGEKGLGITEYFGVKPDILMGTLSKTIPSIGGYICADKSLIEFYWHQASPSLFSAALPPSNIAVGIKSFEILFKEPERILRLRENINYFAKGVKEKGFFIGDAGKTPIIPLIIKDKSKTIAICEYCWNNGIWVNPIPYPAVPKDSDLIRCCISSEHTKEQLDRVIKVLGEALQKFS